MYKSYILLGLLVISMGCIQINAVGNPIQNLTINQTSNITQNNTNSNPMIIEFTPPSCPDNNIQYTLNIKNETNDPLDASIDIFTGNTRLYSGYAQDGTLKICLNRAINAVIYPIIQKQGYISNSQGSNSIPINSNSYGIYIETVYLQQRQN